MLKGKVHKYGADVNTDVILPARYLYLSEPDELAEHCMEDIDADFLKRVQAGDIIMATTNFGCGSSREHAPLAIKAAGISCVIAGSFARIFFRNCVSTGELYPCECSDRLCEMLKTGDVVTVDLDACTVTVKDTGKVYLFKALGEVRPVVDAGGLFNFARQSGMIAS